MVLRGGKEEQPIAYETIMGQAPKECRQVLGELMVIPTVDRVPRTILLAVTAVAFKFARRAKSKQEIGQVVGALDEVLFGGRENRLDIALAFKIVYFQNFIKDRFLSGGQRGKS